MHEQGRARCQPSQVQPDKLSASKCKQVLAGRGGDQLDVIPVIYISSDTPLKNR